jgi:hypothetical protein
MAHMSEFFCKFCAEAMASHAGNGVLPSQQQQQMWYAMQSTQLHAIRKS